MAMLVGCATNHSLPVAPSALAPRAELTDTPFFPQEPEQCGPAALATVLNFHGHTTTPDILRTWIYVPKRGGSLQLEIAATARRHDMLAYPLEGELETLLRELAGGHPVLVLQNLGLSWLPRWHYAVAIGYDLERRVLLLRSGTEHRRETDFDVFMNTWRRGGAWALVIIPPDRAPAAAELETWLNAATDLEATQRYDAAYRAFTTIATRAPDDARAWLGLANNALHVGRADAAAHAYRQSLNIQPGQPITWNNFAYALRDMSCGDEASRAVACAVALAPRDARVADSSREINAVASAPRAATCPALPACPAALGAPAGALLPAQP